MLPASITHTLTMRCTIARKGGSADGWGHQNDYSQVATDVRCYWYVGSGDENVNDQRAVVLTTEQLVVEVGADIQPGDRITKVTDMYGRTVFDVPNYREVKHIASFRNHLNCLLDSSS